MLHSYFESDIIQIYLKFMITIFPVYMVCYLCRKP